MGLTEKDYEKAYDRLSSVSDWGVSWLKEFNINFTSLKLIGAGAHGSVYECNRKDLVVKITWDNDEVDTVSKLIKEDIEGMVRYYGVICDGYNSIIVMDRIDCGFHTEKMYVNMEKKIGRFGIPNNKINIDELSEVLDKDELLMAIQLANTHGRLLKAGIKNQDLHEGNIGFTVAGNVKLIDVQCFDIVGI